MIKTKAVMSDAKGGFFIDEIILNPPQAHEVLVEIKASGLCRSDYNLMLLAENIGVLGHEGAGIVKAIGDGVSNVKCGDAVLLNWATPCKKCVDCKSNKEFLCEQIASKTGTEDLWTKPAHDGILHRNKPISRLLGLGTLARYALVREESVNKINIDIPYSSACIIGCAVMTGWGSVVNVAQVNNGCSAVVLGIGGVGINVLQGLKLSKAKTIIAVDINEQKLDLAKKFGATDVILNTNIDDTLRKIETILFGRKADYVFECTGNSSLVPLAFQSTQSGGKLIQVGVLTGESPIDMNWLHWGKSYVNSFYGGCCPDRDVLRILELYQKKQLRIDEQVTQMFPLNEFQSALNALLKGYDIRVVLNTCEN